MLSKDFIVPQVSVIIPAYNQAHYLNNAINSALSQSFKDYEIFVIDDGSTDDTPETANRYGDRIIYIRQENKGLGGARNTGISHAKGKFIALLDSDDEWHPKFLEKMMEQAFHMPRAVGFYCLARGIDIEGNELQEFFGGQILAPHDVYPALIRGNFIIPSTVVLRRSVFDTVGLFEQENRVIHGCEDWDLWLRILADRQNLFCGLSECLVHYRIHNKSLSDNVERMQSAVRGVVEKNFGLEEGPPTTWTPEKKMAYAGVYRYNLISQVKRRNNWDRAAEYLSKAIQLDPSTSSDEYFYYDLAMGNQPVGQRGSRNSLDVEENARHLEQMLSETFKDRSNQDLERNHSITLGFAYRAMGLLAYNTGRLSVSRKYLLKAIMRHPKLLRDKLVMGNLAKSVVNRSLVAKMSMQANHK